MLQLMEPYHQLIFKLHKTCTRRPMVNMKNTRADMAIQINQEPLEHKVINHSEDMRQGQIAQIRPAVTPSRVKWSERNQKSRSRTGHIVARKEIYKPEAGTKMAWQMKVDMAGRVETLMIVRTEVNSNSKQKLQMLWKSIFMRLTDSQLKRHPHIIVVATQVTHNVTILGVQWIKAPTTSPPD